MHEEALRLTRLLDDLSALADARARACSWNGRRRLGGGGRRQADALAEQFAARGIGVVRRLEPVAVDGDEKRLHQVVANLLANALRYTDEGGRVTSEYGEGRRSRGARVEDTGIGIAEEDQAHVFDRFWRGEKSRSRATGGAGIGLAIVRELVRAHGGEVTVASSPGRGSAFPSPCRSHSRGPPPESTSVLHIDPVGC